MSSPGTLRFGQVATTPSPPPVGYDLIYVKTDDVLYIQDSAGVEVALGSATAITQLTGEVTATGPGVSVATVSNAAVIGKVLTGFTPGPNSPVLATDTILQAIEKLQAQTTAGTGSAVTSLTGDVTGTGPGATATTVITVGGKSASSIATSVNDTQAATSSNTSNTIVKRDASGNFAAGIISAALNGNATTSTTSTNFTGSLSGDVTGTQSATVVSFVGTQSASDIDQSVDDTQAATSSNTSNTIVKRDGSGNFAAGIITASLSGNATTSTTSTNFTGSLSGDVTGTQGATVISSGTVTSKLLTGYTVGSNTPISASDSILGAFEKVQGQLDATTTSAITALTGDATATGPGSVPITLATVNGNVGTFGSSTSIPTFTVNAKGLITAASGNIVIAPAGTLTGTTLNATVVNSSLTSVGTITSGTWNGTTIAIANGGTGQTTANAAFNALSPMTTLGDIIYENATPAAARLPGNITATKQFLSQTGTGSISAVPVWTALVSGDIPNNAANTTGTASNITASSNSTITTLTALSLPVAQLTGVLPIANGGTNSSTTLNNNRIMISSGGAIVENAAITGNRALASNASGLPVASATTDTELGFLSGVTSSVQTQINGKQATGNYITALTGDATATGPGSVPITLATVNGNVGTFGSSTSIPTFTVNAKGLITAASGNVVIAPAGTLTGTTLNATVVNSSLTSVGTITTGVWNGTAIDIAHGGTNNTAAYTAGSVIFSDGTKLTQDNANFYWDDTQHSLGIGVIPASNTFLDIVSSLATATQVEQITGYGNANSIGIRIRRARGTSGSPTAVQSGDNLGFLGTRGYGTSQFAASNTGSIVFQGIENFTNTANGTSIIFNATPTGSVTLAEAFRVAAAGVTLGPQSASTAIAQVNGGIGFTTRTITANLTIDTTTTDYIILANQSGAISITLPAPVNGRVIIIKDMSGTAQTNNITMVRHAAEKIEGLAASKVLQTNWGSWTFTTNGTDWFMV